MPRCRALLLGLGMIGCGYDLQRSFEMDRACSGLVTLTHARALACHPEVEFVAAIDPDREARARFMDVYQRPAWPDLQTFAGLTSSQTLDLVVVAVPPALQPSLVEELLCYFSPRLLLLEKPVATDALAAERLRRCLVRYPTVKVGVNYIRRYLPAVLEMQQRLQAGELGDLLHGRLVYGKGLLSNGSHFVNLAEAWLGPLNPGGQVAIGAAVAGFDREANVTLQAAQHSGAVVQVCSIGGAGLRAGELDLWFSNGRLRWDNNGAAIRLWKPEPVAPGDTHRPLTVESTAMATGMDHYQHWVLESLIRHLEDGSTMPIHCDLDSALKSLTLLEGLLNVGH